MKIRISLLILLIIGTVACHRKVCNFTTFRPLSCEMIPIPMNSLDSTSGIEHTDSMYLNIMFQGQMVETCADLSFPSFSLGSEAMALVLMPSSFEKPLKSFEITSNQAFNDIPAGQSLKNKLWGMLYAGAEKQNVDTYLLPFMHENNTNTIGSTNFLFQFREKPQILAQQLNVVITFKDGRRFEMNNVAAEWK